MYDPKKEEEDRLNQLSSGGNYVPRRVVFKFGGGSGSTTTTSASSTVHKKPAVTTRTTASTATAAAATTAATASTGAKPHTTATTVQPRQSTPYSARTATATTATATATTSPVRTSAAAAKTTSPAATATHTYTPSSASVDVTYEGHTGTRDDPIKSQDYNSEVSLDDCLADLRNFTIGQQQQKKKPQVKLVDTPTRPAASASTASTASTSSSSSSAAQTSSRAYGQPNLAKSASSSASASSPAVGSDTYATAESPAKEDRKKDPFKDAGMAELSAIMGELCSMSTVLNNSGCTRQPEAGAPTTGNGGSSKQQKQQQPKVHDPKNICAKCGKDVGETFYEVEGRRYHTECFRCSKCNGEITEYVITPKGEIICTACNKRLNYVQCKGCHKDVLKSATVSVMGGFYHPECFKCTHCGKRIKDDFLEYNGQPYCTENDNACYKAAACHACATCGQYITGPYMEILGKFYHKDCFSCFKCHKHFDTAEYYAVDNNPYCETCAYEVADN